MIANSAGMTNEVFPPINSNYFCYPLIDELNLLKFIRQKKEAMHEVQDNFHYFHLHMRDLERKLLTENNESDLCSRAVQLLESHELTLLNNLYCLWETNLENRFVNFLKKGVAQYYLDYPLYARFERLISREVELLDGVKPNRLLFIGSGPMPITALCLQHRLGTQIDCLERNVEAVYESKEALRLMGCENRINIFQGYGESIDVSEYDAVLIALLAKPKYDILKNIRETAPDHVKIICRTSEGARTVFYEPTLNNTIPDGMKMVAHNKAGVDDTISSYLIMKCQ